MATVNINLEVQFTLTEIGAVYAAAANIPHVTTKAPMTMSLWEVMQTFGPHIHMGMSGVLFVDNLITLPAPESSNGLYSLT